MFNKGQKVVCIDDNFPLCVLELFVAFPKKGQVYTIREVRALDSNEMPSVLGKDGVEIRVLLQEIINPKCSKTGLERGFKAERFRPLEELTEERVEEEPVLIGHKGDQHFSVPMLVPASPD